MTRKRLSKKQLAVIDDIFAGELDEQVVLDKHTVSRNVYNKWLADGTFADEFDHRIASAHRQSAALIARYAPLAAAKLVQLTNSEKEETARRACLDIISLPRLSAQRTEPRTDESQTSAGRQLSPETASRLLAVLAEERQ
jgi:hypothetical protein